ncbi:hypothetical protein [Microbulbifer sp. JTAC008]|uniref:hypothetical protein n=1 Tax=unclassified Microbulbifer TaxID=2619833 RepID=UPI004039303D
MNNTPKGAMTFAEGMFDYKVDVDVIFNNGRDKKNFVLRTSLSSYSEWKANYCKGASPFKLFVKGTERKAAIIDRELWVFEIDATNVADIIAAVTIASEYFRVSPADIIGNIYVKNLNAEFERDMPPQALVNANKGLYQNTCSAIIAAARSLGCAGPLNFWVFSNSKNPKIRQQALHDALNAGGASNVSTDPISHKYWVGSNDGLAQREIKTNLHLAKLNI